MICRKCSSENTKADIIQTQQIKRSRGFLYWASGLFVIDVIAWFFFTPIKIFMRIIKGPNYRIKTKEQKRLICNDCGYMRRIG